MVRVDLRKIGGSGRRRLRHFRLRSGRRRPAFQDWEPSDDLSDDVPKVARLPMLPARTGAFLRRIPRRHSTSACMDRRKKANESDSETGGKALATGVFYEITEPQAARSRLPPERETLEARYHRSSEEARTPGNPEPDGVCSLASEMAPDGWIRSVKQKAGLE